MKQSLEERLKAIVHHMRGSDYGTRLVRFFELFNLKEIVYYFQAIHDFRNPTVCMKESKQYFEDNQKRIDRVVSFLQDQESKKTYLDMIEFRKTSDWKLLPRKVNTKDPYFTNSFFHYTDGEKYIDCGAYLGDTIDLFVELMKKKGRRIDAIVGFEADKRNYKRAKKRFSDKRIKLYNFGVWDTKSTVRFEQGKDNSSRIIPSSDVNSEKNEEIIELSTINLDSCIECEGVTFLKMDIEGAELRALIGARKLLTKYHPKLAICIYHSDKDMIDIIEWIHSAFPEYKLYVRQHSKSKYETIVYATL